MKPLIQSPDQNHKNKNKTILPFSHTISVDKDTVEFSVLGLRAHTAQLLLVAAQAPGVVTDLLRTQTAIAV